MTCVARNITANLHLLAQKSGKLAYPTNLDLVFTSLLQDSRVKEAVRLGAFVGLEKFLDNKRVWVDNFGENPWNLILFMLKHKM